MIRAFRYPLSPTPEQEATLNVWLRACCDLYNAALQERKDAWDKQRVMISRYTQQKELTELRAAESEWRNIPVLVVEPELG